MSPKPSNQPPSPIIGRISVWNLQLSSRSKLHQLNPRRFMEKHNVAPLLRLSRLENNSIKGRFVLCRKKVSNCLHY